MLFDAIKSNSAVARRKKFTFDMALKAALAIKSGHQQRGILGSMTEGKTAFRPEIRT